MTKRGPKKTQYDIKVIKELILKFNKENNYKGTIKYIDIYEYAKQMYENGDFPYKTSYDFWKRQSRVGREVIDDYNKVKTNQIISTNNQKIDFIDIADVLSKFVNDEKVRDKLERYLMPMEKQVRDLVLNLEKKDKKIKKSFY